MSTRRVYNLKRHVQDQSKTTDFHARRGAAPLPAWVDLRPKMPPIFDQGNIGSCTSQAGAAAIQFFHWAFEPSRLYLYYQERLADGDPLTDSGSSLTQCVETLTKVGVCSEKAWPYVESKFADKPPAECDKEAAEHRAIKSEPVAQTLESLKACLASGHPILIGITVYESFESEQVAKNGVVPMPDVVNEQILGGHAVLLVSYTEKSKFICRNSWGKNWGEAGYFYLSFEYVLNPSLASDFHAITSITKAD